MNAASTQSRLLLMRKLVPVKQPNQVKGVTKNNDGSLTCSRGDGTTFVLSPQDKLFQEFVIWTMINPECRE
jgi:hypothetical protein